MGNTTVRLLTKDEDFSVWDDLVFATDGAGYLQYNSWLNTYRSVGFKPLIWGVFDSKGSLRAGAGILSFPVPIIKKSLAVCPHGPVIPLNAEDLWSQAWPELKRHWRQQGFIQLQFQPREEIESIRVGSLLKSLGTINKFTFKGVPLVQKGLCIELSDFDSDTLLAGFRKETRKAIRQGIKAGIEIKPVQDRADLEKAWEIQNEASERLNYPSRPKEMFVEPFFELILKKRAIMLAAYNGEKLLGISGAVFTKNMMWDFVRSNTIHGAKSRAAYLLLWSIIQKGLDEGCNGLDLGGIVKDGIGMFKKGFRPRNYELVPPNSIVLSPILYRFYYYLEPHLLPLRYKIAGLYSRLKGSKNEKKTTQQDSSLS